jgi:cytochrome c
MRATSKVVLAGFLALGVPAAAVHAADDAAASAEMKKSGCMTCHSVSAKKDGPSFKSIAEKYKGKAEGADKVKAQITTSKEHSQHVKTKDDAQIKNVVDYILSR